MARTGRGCVPGSTGQPIFNELSLQQLTREIQKTSEVLMDFLCADVTSLRVSRESTMRHRWILGTIAIWLGCIAIAYGNKCEERQYKGLAERSGSIKMSLSTTRRSFSHTFLWFFGEERSVHDRQHHRAPGLTTDLVSLGERVHKSQLSGWLIRSAKSNFPLAIPGAASPCEFATSKSSGGQGPVKFARSESRHRESISENCRPEWRRRA